MASHYSNHIYTFKSYVLIRERIAYPLYKSMMEVSNLGKGLASATEQIESTSENILKKRPSV